MKKIKIIIEKTKDLYTAYSDNVDGIFGGGISLDETKDSIIESINLLRTFKNCPKILQGEYEIEYQYDIESFLVYYKGIFTPAVLERLTGTNQKQIQHYASGLKKPRLEQRKKIEASLHKLGKELLALHF